MLPTHQIEQKWTAQYLHRRSRHLQLVRYECEPIQSSPPSSIIGFNGGDTNLYSYCYSNPINCVDPDGEFGLVGAGIGAGIEIGFQAYSNYQNNKSLTDIDNYDLADIVISAAVGAISPGWIKVGNQAKVSFKTVSRISTRLNYPVGIKYATHLQSAGVNELIKVGKITGLQLGFQGAKYMAREVNHNVCPMNGEKP